MAGPDGAESPSQRLDRVLDRIEANQHRLKRVRAAFPSFKKIFLVLSLAFISWYATYTGMLELIRANTGSIPPIEKIALAFAVMTLMGMVLYILDSLFSPISWWLRSLYIVGYVFLTLISVGFSFGFFWRVLESRAASTRSAEAAIGQVQQSLEQGKVRLAELGATLTSLAQLSQQKAVQEREHGGTCPDSPPGDGPRRRMREQDAKDFAFTANFIKSRSAGIETEMKTLDTDLGKVLSRDPSTFNPKTGTRNDFLTTLNRELDLTATRFNALRTDPQLAAQRNALAKRAQETVFPDGHGGTFRCPDPQLQTALLGAVNAINSLPEIPKTTIAAVEGPEAVVEAFRRLTTTFVGLLHFKLPPTPEELRAQQRQAVQLAHQQGTKPPPASMEQAGLGPRDYIPLCVALFVDFCLLLVSINRPINRFQGLLTTVREAGNGPVGELLSRFHESHERGLGKAFEMFQHAVFDFLGDYYVAVPVNATRPEALYLSNLFVGLEGKGIIDRAMLPPLSVVRRKLRLQGSMFADEPALRLYRFRNGAWSKLVIEAILGDGRSVRSGAFPANLGQEGKPPDGREAKTADQNAADQNAGGEDDIVGESASAEGASPEAEGTHEAALRPALPAPDQSHGSGNGHGGAPGNGREHDRT